MGNLQQIGEENWICKKKKSFQVALEDEIRKSHKYTTRNMLCYDCRGMKKRKTPFGIYFMVYVCIVAFPEQSSQDSVVITVYGTLRMQQFTI